MKWIFILLILKFIIVHSLNDTTTNDDDDTNIYIDIIFTSNEHTSNDQSAAVQRTFDNKPEFQALYSFGLYTDYSSILTNEIVENYIQAVELGNEYQEWYDLLIKQTNSHFKSAQI